MHFDASTSSQVCTSYLYVPGVVILIVYAILLTVLLLVFKRNARAGTDQEEERASDDDVSFLYRIKRFGKEAKAWFDDFRHDHVLVNLVYIAQGRLVLLADVLTDVSLSLDELSRGSALSVENPALASLHMNNGMTMIFVILLPYMLMSLLMFPIHPLLNLGGSGEVVTFESLEDVRFCVAILRGPCFAL